MSCLVLNIFEEHSEVFSLPFPLIPVGSTSLMQCSHDGFQCTFQGMAAEFPQTKFSTIVKIRRYF